jgi:hypothetical protein
MRFPKYICWLLPLLLSACDLEQDAEIDLPYYEPQLVVESYLIPGKQLTATVLESSSYFDTPTIPLVPDAEVYITTPAGERIQLQYKPAFIEGGNAYTHISSKRLEGKPGDVYALEVKDGKGRHVTGFTTILPQIPIEEIVWKFNDKGKAYLLTSFQDNPNVKNYYRYITQLSAKDGDSDTRDFAASDEFTNGERTSYGSGYEYEQGDTLLVSLYHIEKQYYDFLNSTEDAKDANGNPFAQPSKVISSVQGGIGIFTNLIYDRKKVIIE